MSELKVRNFGPIKAGYQGKGGWLDIKKATVFVGNQGSGKSTVAKLISICIWMEKSLVRGDIKAKDLETYNRFRKKYCAYQNIHNFFREDSEIEFQGVAYSFAYKDSVFKVIKNQTDGNIFAKAMPGEYLIPKVMYVPAERNFISAVVQLEKLKSLPLTLYTFLEEFIRANEEIEDTVHLPINNLSYSFHNKKRAFKLLGDEYEILLSEASSGLQSSVPLFLVSKNLSEGIDKSTGFTKTRLSFEKKEKIRKELLKILTDDKTNDSVKSGAVDLLSSITKNDCFINIVEEPEQNLFPDSQQKMLHSLLEFNGKNTGNKLIMTTHSPYLINYLTLAVKADELKEKIETAGELKEKVKTENLGKLNDIVPLKSALKSDDLAIYELNEIDGSIKSLEVYDGLPSDENKLNERLGKSNELFACLLEIQQGLGL